MIGPVGFMLHAIGCDESAMYPLVEDSPFFPHERGMFGVFVSVHGSCAPSDDPSPDEYTTSAGPIACPNPL